MTATQPQTEPTASPSSADHRLALLPPQAAAWLTDIERGWLEAALMGCHRQLLCDVLADLKSETAQLWAIVDAKEKTRALIVTRLMPFDQSNVLLIQLCGGEDVHAWLPLIAELEGHARALGCTHVEITGRRGWERLLPDYTFRGIQLAKELR